MPNNLPCPHLAPVVEEILGAGATNIGPTPGGSEYRFVHQLSKGPTIESARMLATRYGVEFWINNDSRSGPIDCGLSCSKCRVAVAWLQERATVAI